MIIDTHCHLDDASFDADLDAVLDRAQSIGVRSVIIPGADIADLDKACEIAHAHRNVYFAAGVHPYEIKSIDMEVLERYADDPKCVGIGECGLDYFRLKQDPEAKSAEISSQKQAFISQIDLAIKFQKPLIVHIRDANEDSFKILKERADELCGGVLHCFNASKLLLSLAESGFYFGIGGVLTFKNAKNLAEILPQIPLERLLIETDAPYLTPHPHRGERNEPAYTRLVVEKIAEILNLSVSEIEKITSQNACRLFGDQIKGEL